MLLAAGAAVLADSTETVTNYVTPVCFEPVVASLSTANAESSGFAVVIVYANPDEVTYETETQTQDVTETTRVTSYATTSAVSTVTFSVTDTITATSSHTSCGDEGCVVMVSTVTTSTVYESCHATTYTTVVPVVKTEATGNDKNDDTNCAVCQTVALVELAKTTLLLTIYEASVTPSPTPVSTLPGPIVTQTQLNPVSEGKTVLGGSSIASSSWNPSSLVSSVALNSTRLQSTQGSSETGLSSTSSAESTNAVSSVDPEKASSVTSSAGFESSAAPSSASENSASLSSFSLSATFSGFSNSLIISSQSSSALSLSSSSLLGSSSAVSSSVAASSSLLLSSSSSVISSSTTLVSSSSETPSSTVSSTSSPTPSRVITWDATCNTVSNLFAVIDTSNPTAYWGSNEVPLSIPAGVSNLLPYETNKFYANFFLSPQTLMAWTYPYGFYWDNSNKYGFAVQHTDISQRVEGAVSGSNTVSYYYNPILTGEIIFSATSISSGNNYLGMDSMTAMSARATLSATQGDSTNYIEFPLVQGMGYATSVYHGNTVPRISSIYAFTLIVREIVASSSATVQKYRVTLNNNAQWLLFVTLPADRDSISFAISNGNIVASNAVDGLIIQAVYAPSNTQLDNYYYQSAGQYVTTAAVSGLLSCLSTSYQFTWTTAGSSIAGAPIVFALPHHLQTLTADTTTKYTGITLDSTTKGTMRAFLTNTFSFSDTVDTTIQFFPHVTGSGTSVSYSPSQLTAIHNAAVSELSGVDIVNTILDYQSMYYMGKAADKYAYILLTVHEIVEDTTLTANLLSDLKAYYAKFLANQINWPLFHDTRYGGVTSTAAFQDNGLADFGMGFYNDHHFHFGYHIHALAVIGYVDQKLGGTWANDNKQWINTLVRDVANPLTSDPYFPVSRLFDWFHGHSWAKGLFTSGDGKDEESSSEDYNFSYGMKLWGHVIGDSAMEARGDVMLKIQSRSMNLYFLYLDDNTVEPSNYIGNKVSGILMDNKIAYTTYFGDNIEYIHGIHMLPITPASSLIRGATFVSQEWTEKLQLIVGSLSSGWLGILRLNQALYDAATAYSFFTSSSFSSNYLDGGQSLTWSLVFSAGISNA